MTWNIHGAVGRNPRFDLQRVIELILRADPDIIALQEVDSRRAPPGEDPFRILQNELGSHGVGAKSIVAEDGEYGQTLISRWPMHGTRTHDISYGEFEPRCAIETNVSTPDGELRVIAAHLGPVDSRAPQPDARAARHGRGGGGDGAPWRLQRLVLAGFGALGAGACIAGTLAPSDLSVLVPDPAA